VGRHQRAAVATFEVFKLYRTKQNQGCWNPARNLVHATVVVVVGVGGAHNVGTAWAGHVNRLNAPIVFCGKLVFHGLAFSQRAETVLVNGGLVYENVWGAIVRDQEAKALGAVEPLHSAAHFPIRREEAGQRGGRSVSHGRVRPRAELVGNETESHFFSEEISFDKISLLVPMNCSVG